MRKRFYRTIITLTMAIAILFGISACGNDTSETETFPTETESAEEPETESEEKIESESTEKEESVKEESQKEETKESESDSKKESESKEESKAESSTKPTDTKESKTNNSSKTAESTPQPTTAPHTHSYVESVISNPTCANEGQKQFVCSCGDSRIESIPRIDHNWTPIYGTVEHPSVGEMRQVQVGTSGDVYTCCYCGAEFGSHSDITNHWLSYDDLDHAGPNYLIRDGGPIYENQWVVTQEAWTETVVTGYQCSVCGATK